MKPVQKLREQLDLTEGDKAALKSSLKLINSYDMYNFAVSLAEQRATHHQAYYAVIDTHGIGWTEMATHFARVVLWMQTDEGKRARGVVA